jgi:hypothetical protein
MRSPNFDYIANDNQDARHNMQQVVGFNVDFHAGCKKFTSFDDFWGHISIAIASILLYYPIQ